MLFRNRRLVRAIACFFLLELVGSMLAPTVSWAMMGPSQPEFTSYEAPGATDMVNLSTGDFSFNIPVLEIPGPERSFSLPLNYKAGIQLEQEATWVGLGWSLNPGAIVRSINGYADDASGDEYTSTYKKFIERDETIGVPGIFEFGWNSNTGNYGSIDLLGIAGFNWDKDGESIEAMGVSMSTRAGQGISIDPVRVVTAAMSIASLGTSTAIANGIGFGISVAMGVGMSAAGVGRLGGTQGFMNRPSIEYQYSLFSKRRTIQFDNTSTEKAYGSLYFGDMSNAQTPAVPFAIAFPGASAQQIQDAMAWTNYANNYLLPVQRGPQIHNGSQAGVVNARPFPASRYCTSVSNITNETAADIYQSFDKENSNYYESSMRPISTAHDYFNVLGEGISGSIRPYRLEVGSVAYPKLGREECEKHYKYNVVPFLSDYKVGFRYENSIANTYDSHEYTAPSGSSDFEGIHIDNGDRNTGQAGSLTITDPSLYNDASNANALRTGAARKGLHNASTGASTSDRRFVQGKHITWYSNGEIADMYAASANGNGNGFLEFAHPTPTANSNNSFRTSLPAKGIGAFEVTSEDGSIYHYSLPVYNHATRSISREIYYNVTTRATTNPAGIPAPNTLGLATQTSGGPGKSTATTWLLTAITSADYVDRNGSGTVDDADWGGWVAFEYGKLSSQYHWRQPYTGGYYPDNERDPNVITAYNMTEGYRDTYYLNSISTRTHTALFVKSLRADGKGFFAHGVDVAQSNFGIDDRTPSASMRLDEIILMDNITLDSVRTPDRIRNANDTGPAIPALSNNTGNNSTHSRTTLNTTTGNGVDTPFSPYDNMASVLDKHDLDIDSRVRNFVNKRAIKRIAFNYGYDLCVGTPNSFAIFNSTPGSQVPRLTRDELSVLGKLTLKSVSFFGPSTLQPSTNTLVPTELIPNFTFNYGDPNNPGYANPAYNRERWDGFGMYNGKGAYSPISHRAAQWGSNSFTGLGTPTAWSLTKITNPLGGVTDITYERDQYAHVSEFGTTRMHLRNTNSSAVLEATFDSYPDNQFNVTDLSAVVHPGDTIPLTGRARFMPCVAMFPFTFQLGPRVSPDGLLSYTDQVYDNNPSIVSNVNFDQGLQKWFVTLASPPAYQLPVPETGTGFSCPSNPRGLGADIETVVPCNVLGGDLRVSSITTSDGLGQSYKSLYKYEKPGPAFCNSTGVISKEPSFVKRFEHAFYDWFDFPATPVLYSEVTVLRGILRDGVWDTNQREVYAFETPASYSVRENNRTTPGWRGTGTFYNPANTVQPINNVELRNNKTVVNTGKIGQPKWVRKYNAKNELELSTDFEYSHTVANPDNIARQGQFTEGVMSNEMLDFSVYRINRSTKTYYPSVLVGSKSTRNGVSIANQNTLYDFYTGQVIETKFQNSRGETYRTLNVPAYTKAPYTTMGPKGENATNSNMLVQQTAGYVFKELPGSSQLVSAGVQEWNNTWNNYRLFDGINQYADAASPRAVWREKATYSWQSPLLNPNGTYAVFEDFSWNGPSNRHWVKTSEALRYNEYSHVLENKDVNGEPSAQKLGYSQSKSIATASNSRYTELAFSGAEDKLPGAGVPYYGGEVALGGGTQDATVAHTGRFSTNLSSQATGLLYRAVAGPGRDLELNKAYRASVWVHATNAVAGRLFASVNGVTLAEASLSSPNTKKAGSWYRLTLTATIPTSATNASVVFGCRNAGGGSVNVDDFRVCPLKASMASRVYDQRTSRLTYVLDDENLFTHYEYDKAGRTKRVYKESFDRPSTLAPSERLIKEYDYNYAHSYDPVWEVTRYFCETHCSGAITGYQMRTERDINPYSPTYNTTQNILNGLSPDCHVCGQGSNPPELFVWAPLNTPTPTGPCPQGRCETGFQTGTWSGPCVGGSRAWGKVYSFPGTTATVNGPQENTTYPCGGQAPPGPDNPRSTRK